MMLCLRKGRDDPKDLERVLSVLDRRLYYGSDGGVVFHAGLRAEASADLEFGLGRPERLLAVVVRGWDGRVRQEGEDVVPVLGDALFELVQLGRLPVFLRVDWRSGKQFVQASFHFRPHILPDVSLMPVADRVLQKVKHVQAPCVIREGLHRVGEIPQQVGDADLVVLHPDIPHEVGGPAVGHPDDSALLLMREVLVHDIMAPALVKGQEGRDRVLKSPEPVVLAVHVDSCLVGAGHLPGCDLPAYHLVWRLGELAHGIQHVGYGPLADVQSEDGLEQVGETLERDVLISAQIRSHGHDVRAVGDRRIHIFRELSLAAVPAGALDLHLKMAHDRSHDRKRDVHHLPRGGNRRGFHVQRFSALGADGRGIPALRPGHVLGLQPRAALMPLLAAGLPAGWLPLRLRMRDAYRVLGGRDAAVGAGLRNGLSSAFEFRYLGFELRDFLVFAGDAAVKAVIGKSLLVEFFGELRRFEILRVPHFAKKLLTPAGQSHYVRLDALFQSRIEVLFHTANVRKRFDIRKFNKLNINALKAVLGLSSGLDTSWIGGPNERFSGASARPTKGGRRLIFGDPERGLAAWT